MIIKGEWDNHQKNALRKQLKILQLTNKQKTRIHRNSIKEAKKRFRKNITAQADPTGKKWKGRALPRAGYPAKKGKMLKRILSTTRNVGTPEYGEMKFNHPVAQRIASEHQYGGEYQMPKAKISKPSENDVVKRAGGATLAQAQALLRAGFNEPVNPRKQKHEGKASGREVMTYWVKRMLRGGKTRKPSSVGYIMENLSFEYAGTLLRLLNEQKGKVRVRPKLPAREFVDERPETAAEIMRQEVEKEIRVN